MRAAFIVIAIGFAAGALYHGAALFDPSIAEPSPPWRHALFVAINAAFAIGMLKRPRGFVFAFAALAAQQLYSHGIYGVDVWRREARIDWASVVVVVAMPIVLALLVRDARATAKPSIAS
jgi:hypothetical protein